MQHTIEVAGERRTIDVRPMDEGFIAYRKMYVPPLTPENIGQIGAGDWAEHLEKFQRQGWQALIADFLRKQTRALGSCAILAWDGGGVIGKMYFTTREMAQAYRERGGYLCVEHRTMPAVIQSLDDGEISRLLDSESRTLRILCFNVGHFDVRYHSKGIASAMLEVLKSWAKDRGCRRLEIESCPDVVPFWALGPHVLRRGPLERRGFRIVADAPVGQEEAEFRRRAIKRIIQGEYSNDEWDVRTYPENLELVRAIATNSAWEDECARDYLMTFDLQSP